MPGTLRRDVVNFLGITEPTPPILLPLLDRVAARHADDGYFLGRLAEHLSDARDRADTAADVRRATIGYGLWRDQREALVRWANTSTYGPFVDDELLQRWLIGRRNTDLVVVEAEHLQEFLDCVHLDPDDARFLEDDLRDSHLHRIFIHQLHKDLHWLHELARLRRLAHKAWQADVRER